MYGDINSASGRLGVVAKQAKERIKRRGRIRIQKRVPQSRLADLAYGQELPLIARVTETKLPIPSLEIIAKFSQLALEPDVEETIPVGELFTSGTGVVNTAELNPS